MSPAADPRATDPPDLSGRTIVVTGASAGIGAAAARRLAAAGARVLPVGRDPRKTAAVAREIGAEPLVADFARLDDVRRLAERVLATTDRVDVLANNAGGVFKGRRETEDGHEMTFQVNHLAGFLLTNLLRERLLATPGSRVVTTSSAGNLGGRVDLDDLDSRRGRYSSFRAYSTSKLLNILFTRELARRWDGGVHASAFHPGAVASEFGRDSVVAGLFYRTPLKRVLSITPEAGAAPLVALAARPDPEAVDGAYLHRFAPGRAARQADDLELARGLWDRSAAMVGLAA
jgi:NAD(P)-dependent dehydrogenase (short-subunit alcohol dehydrogenase family)